MKDSKYYISASMKSHYGWIEYARFFISNDEEQAIAIFDDLQGDREEAKFLRMDLMERSGTTDLLVSSIFCTAPDLADNCRIITRELFRLCNLEEKI